MSQRKVEQLKQCLNSFTDVQIKRARAKLSNARGGRARCWRKLAEIDAQFNVCRGLITALDLCGGPGEFAAYIMARNPLCQVFGVTLATNAPYKRKVLAQPNFTLVLGPDKTGNVLDKNVLFDLSVACGNVCDLVVADGAVDAAGCENEQERLNMPLILRETQLALICLRPGGNCVLKVFDAFHDATINMLVQFVGHFAQWRLVKPASSRAANSERYLVCTDKLVVPRIVDNEAAALRRAFRKFNASQCKHLSALLHELNKHGSANV